MIKALSGRKTYYIFAKETGKKAALIEVAIKMHEKTDNFEVLDAKQIGEEDGYALYEIGTKGDFLAVTRKEKKDV